MINEAFLICALSLPGFKNVASTASEQGIVFTAGFIPRQFTSNEEQKLIDWLKKKGGADEVFIHPEPQEEVLEREGWERVPFTWNGNKIWIRRKPKSDKKLMETSA